VMGKRRKEKKIKLGHVLPKRKTSRIQNDGDISLKKAQENKKKGDLEDNYSKKVKPKNLPKILLQKKFLMWLML
jgi:hypothetical protein